MTAFRYVAAIFVRVARKSREIPSLKHAISAGEVTVTKAKTIVSVITPATTQTWIQKASTLSKHNLEKEVARAAPHPLRPERARPVGAGRVRVEFELDNEIAELQRRARDLASAKLGKSANLEETQRLLLECFLNRHDPVRKADRVVNRKRGARDQSRGRREKLAAPPPTRRRNLAEVRHAVNRHDRGRCQARLPDGSVCGDAHWVHHHHLIPLAAGGADAAKNITTLCSAHHRLWHARQSGGLRPSRPGP